MIRPTNDGISTTEKDEICFYEISCGIPPDIFDLIINCKSTKEIWDVIKNLYVGID